MIAVMPRKRTAPPAAPQPTVGFRARVRRDESLTAIVETLEASARYIPYDELAAVLLDWSPAEYAEPPLAPAAVAITHEDRLRLYELRAARNLSLFHHPTRTTDFDGGRRHTDSRRTDTLIRLPNGAATIIRCDVLDAEAFGELMLRTPGEQARAVGWISLKLEEDDGEDEP